jgi:hypothetical protein
MKYILKQKVFPKGRLLTTIMCCVCFVNFADFKLPALLEWITFFFS